MAGQHSEFGYYPRPLDMTVGPVSIATRDGLEERMKDVGEDDWRDGRWIYAPLQPVDHLGGGTSIRPYPARVFGLPKTHDIVHATAPDLDPVNFHVWSLSFFSGMRFTITEAGFLDSTPIEPGVLVDFVLLGGSLPKSIELAEAFWIDNLAFPERARIWAAAVHALFLSQNPRHLQHERFLLLYTALDACFALAKSLNPPARNLTHSQRIAWMCDWLGMPIPAWADPGAGGGAPVAAMRNPAIHEALFMGEPLGFALHGVGERGNLTLEMSGLVSRLLVALLGARNNRYINSSTGTRQRQGLDLG
ncbi:hypothetical protein [Sphingopyxis sp. R3-92]|uniref:hypothetical protein n=1 Tax=Sphingopyxis sp. R3-92 TaxID=3158553 RepID=UPI003EE81285